MDKSIIMFDTPDSCGECFCQKGYTVYGYACGLTNRMNKDAHCRPGWCPLIPLPERHIASKTATGYEIGYEDGWNECLEKIVGGEQFEKLRKNIGKSLHSESQNNASGT